MKASLAVIVMSATFAMGSAQAAAPAEKAAPAPAPEQSTPPATASPQAAPEAATTPQPAPPPPPAPEPLPQSPLVAEPPGAADVGVARPEPPRSSLDALVERVSITDIALALFALAVVFFAFRTSSSNARLRSFAERQAEDSRRAVEASEKAADSAERSAHAAEQALATMRDTAERQLRPYVTVRQFLQAPVKDERQNVHGWLLQVAWQNSGTTPTRGFRYWAMLREFDGTIPDDFEFTPAGLKDFAGGELGSNGTVNSPPLFVTQQQISRIQDGSRKALLLGQADYSDMAGTVKRETKFCVELVLVNDPSGANGSPFSFSYYPKYNSIT